MQRIEIGCTALALSASLVTGLPVHAQRSNSDCDQQAGSPVNVPELKHGLLQGYLNKALPDSMLLLDGPPPAGSAAEALDKAKAEATFAHRNTPRWQLAAKDADLHFPAASPMPASPPIAPKTITSARGPS